MATKINGSSKRQQTNNKQQAQQWTASTPTPITTKTITKE
jgi:hypothetical protein